MGKKEKRSDGEEIKEPLLYLSKHPFDDMSHVCPLVFVYLLKESYARGKCKPSSYKFEAHRQVLVQVFQNHPQHGPAVFAAHCLYVLPLFESRVHTLSHLVLSAFGRFLKLSKNAQTDTSDDAKVWPAKLFAGIVSGTAALNYNETVLAKIVHVFDVDLPNIGKAICGSHITAEMFVQQYAVTLVERGAYTTTVFLLEHFGIRGPEERHSFLLKRLVDEREYGAAEKWARFTGRRHLCVLVGEYFDRKLDDYAYDVIGKHNMREEFPVAYRLHKEMKLRKLAEKGCWDVAETRTNNDRQLLQYLVYLAMEVGYLEKVEELCNRYSLEGFTNIKDPKASRGQSHYYLQLKDLGIEEVVWVDNENGLHNATCYIEKCKVVGLDCEWKPKYEKGGLPNKVSIMQIASERKAYILDLIKLHNDVPVILDECLMRILHFPGLLKLGYNFECDMHELARSYERLQCFKRYEMVLNIENVFKEPRGGLSGLTKKILGSALNKTRRMSNWEQRPLTQNQLEYAALDAAVLIHIFHHVGGHKKPGGGNSDEHYKIKWKSQIISRPHIPITSKKKRRRPKRINESDCIDADVEK